METRRQHVSFEFTIRVNIQGDELKSISVATVQLGEAWGRDLSSFKVKMPIDHHKPIATVQATACTLED